MSSSCGRSRLATSHHAFAPGIGGGIFAFLGGRLQQPPALNCVHAHFSQRISATASHSATASASRSRRFSRETTNQH